MEYTDVNELIRQARQKNRIMSDSEMQHSINFVIDLIGISIKGLEEIENPTKDESKRLKRLKMAIYEIGLIRPQSL